MKKLGIGTGIFYPTPAHLQPAFSNLGYKPGSFPHAEKLCEEVVSLPVVPEMTEEEIDQVCTALGEVCR